MAYGDNPGARTPAKKPKKKIRRTKAPSTTDRTSPNPSTPKAKKGPVAPQQTGKIRRPAPKRQPGPVSDKERRRVRKHKETESYQESLREARKHGPATRRGTRRPGGDDKSDADRARGKDYVRSQYVKEYGAKLKANQITVDGKQRYGYRKGSTVPPDVQRRVDKSRLKEFSDDATAARTAPVGKALEQTTRPLHAIAGAAKSEVQNIKKDGFSAFGSPERRKRNLDAAVKGIKNEEKTTFSDVLDEAGVKNKAVKGTVGFALDVAADPTTYITGGSTTAAKIASKGARKTAEKKAVKAGLSSEQVKRMGDRAAKQAEKKAGDSRGVTVRFAGKEIVPGTGRATAKVGGKIKRATDKPRLVRKVKDTVRHVAADVNPNIKPDNISRVDYDRARQAARTARSSTAREVEKAKHRAAGLRKAVGDEDQRVLDAIESGNVKDLPDHLRKAAKRFQDDMKHARRLERRAGIPTRDYGRKKKLKVPKVTANVEARREALQDALSTRGRLQARQRRADATVPSREEFIKNRPKASRLDEPPTVKGLSRNLKPGRFGTRVESLYMALTDPITKEQVDWGKEIQGLKAVVARDRSGNPIGVLYMTLDSKGKADILEVAVDPAHRGKGLASKLYAKAEGAGFDVEKASGRGGYTEAGAALAHKRLVARTEKDRKLNSKEVRSARAAIGKAEADLVREKKVLRTQRLAKRRVEKLNATPGGRPRGYVPHALAEPLEKGEGIRSVGAKSIKPGFTKARSEHRTLKELREHEPGKYSEDAALLHANRMVESAVASKRAELNRTLLDMGRRLKKGSTDVLNEGEAVVHIKGSNVRVLDKKSDKAEVDKLLREGNAGRGGQYVILNKQTVERAIKGVVPAGERTTIGRLFDKGQGGWKFLATVPNPGFHVRNLVGDTQNAYLAESAGKLAVNVRHSGKALKRLGKREDALRTLNGRVDPDGKGIRIKGKPVTYDELLDEAEKHGAIRSGFINRELPELLKGTEATGLGKPSRLRRAGQKVSQSKPGRSVGRTLQNREDLMRLATYIGGRKRGLSPEQAVARMSKYHFDYADLTTFERSFLRRAMPFYTFSARNIPLQLKSYFTKPGKFANYQKIREETAKAFGVDMDDAEAGTAEYEQRSAPVYIKWKGKDFTLSFGPSGLPLTDLNEMPLTDGSPTKTADEWMQRAMSLVTPAAKTPVELWSNFSFFFRDQIERETGPLVPVSNAIVKTVPKGLRDDLGMVPDFVDPRTGKKGWGWPAKHDYVASVLPGPLNFINRVTTPSDRKGQSVGARTLAYAGLRAGEVDRTSTTLQNTYEERAKVGKSLASMRQRANPANGEKVSADNPTPAYLKALAEHKRLTGEIEVLRVKRGDKLVPRRGRPAIKSPSGGDSFWGSGSSDSSFWDG